MPPADADLAEPPRLIDIAKILAPLPTGAAAPHDDSDDPALTAIREARREDRDLPVGVWQTDLKKADWAAVIRLSTAYLTQSSKHLRVASFLVEALVHQHGFAGLTTGYALLCGLVEKHWSELLPSIDEDGDITARVNLFDWLNARLTPLLAALPLTRSSGQNAGHQSWCDYQNALLAERAKQRGAKFKDGDPQPMPLFQASVAATPTTNFLTLRGQLIDAIQGHERLDALLRETCGQQAPSMARLGDSLNELRNFTETVLHERHAMPSFDQPALPEDLDYDHEPVAARHSGNGIIGSRDEAYALLAEIAEYLAETEPHSPTPYLLQRAVTWGRMPLHELLGEMSQGRNDLASVFALLGVLPEK